MQLAGGIEREKESFERPSSAERNTPQLKENNKKEEKRRLQKNTGLWDCLFMSLDMERRGMKKKKKEITLRPGG